MPIKSPTLAPSDNPETGYRKISPRVGLSKFLTELVLIPVPIVAPIKEVLRIIFVYSLGFMMKRYIIKSRILCKIKSIFRNVIKY
jgi:hypothetical protein